MLSCLLLVLVWIRRMVCVWLAYCEYGCLVHWGCIAPWLLFCELDFCEIWSIIMYIWCGVEIMFVDYNSLFHACPVSLSGYMFVTRFPMQLVWVVVNYWSAPITVAARSEAWTVFARSNTRVLGSNPTRGMDVCVRLFCVCVVLCVGRGLATGWSPIQGVLLSVHNITKLKTAARAQQRTVEP
jgi:hypothetical protein